MSERSTSEIWLQIQESGNESGIVCLTEDALLGRDFRCDVVVHDDEASRMHARLTPGIGHEWTLTDLATTNGTYVNNERIVGPAKVGIGDVIRVGRATCTIVPAAL